MNNDRIPDTKNKDIMMEFVFDYLTHTTTEKLEFIYDFINYELRERDLSINPEFFKDMTKGHDL